MGSDQEDVWGRWASSSDRPDRDDRIDKVVTDYSNLPRDSTRVPLAHRIQLKFDRFTGFINEYLSNISPGGIFIRTETPEPPGQLLDFEFRLGDGYELIRGRGEVVWARERSDGPERPPGMGVRFIELSPGSKDLIYKIVDDYAAHGGKPFDLTPPAAALSAPPPAPAATAPAPAATAPAPSAAVPPPVPPAPPAAGAPGLPPPAGPPRPTAARQPAGPSSLPWTLEIPAIQPLPGVPAITPRSPLESLGAGAGPGPGGAPAAGAGLAASAGPAAGAVPATGGLAAAEPAIDPLAQVVAALPPLEELAPDVPSLPPAPAPAAPPPLAATAPVQAPPAFSSFDLRAVRRRSPLPLLGVLVAIALLGLAAYLLRDTMLTWIENREAAQQQASPSGLPAPAAARTAPALPAGRRAAGAPATAALPANGGGPVAVPGPAASPGQAPTTPAAAGAAPPPARTAPAAAASQAPTGGLAGRPVLEPVATAGDERGNGASGSTAGRVTAVERITWQAAGDGTEVVLWGNGEFPSQSYTRERIGTLPVREVVRISGIDRPYASARLAVHSPELVQIRTGYHPPRDLHVVLDLGSRDVQVTGIEPGPRQLRIHLRTR